MQGTQLTIQFNAPPRFTPATQPRPPLRQGPPPGPAVAPAEIAGGAKAKTRDILGAIRTLKMIEQEQRPATSEERQALIRFGGFGPVALSIFPDPITGRYKDAGWQALGEELQTLLTPEEYDSARRTVFNAFYTSSTVIRAMHEALGRLGVPGNATVLEPGCGPGRFLYLAPPGMRFIGVELDSISGRIARALHPEADIRIENFRDSRLPEIDAVIGNCPFADIKLEHRGQKFSLHDYFFAKSVDSLKPGGVLALVTSHYTLDKVNASIREYLAERADFLGAIRLPSDAFHREGTSVVADIVILRKRGAGEQARHADPGWLQVAPLSVEGIEVPVNRYFLNHPEMVLGSFSRKDTLYGEGYSVTGTGDLAGQLREAIGRLPEIAPSPIVAVPAEPKPRPFTPPPPLPHIAEGSFCVGDDRAIRQIIDGRAEPVTYGGTKLTAYGNKTGKRLAALVGLRDKARRVLQSQNEGWPEEARNDARRELNGAYDRFSFAYGPINQTSFSETKDGHVIRRMPNIVKFREDPDAMLVLSLEDYDEITGKAAKAAIMQRDVVGRKPPVMQVSSAEEGLLVSLDQRGAVDLPFIATLYGKPESQVIAELGELIFHDPQTQTWQTADAYLSGNVREKLAAAEKAGPAYARNAQALRGVQPEDVLPGDIDANLGAPWIPKSDIQAFAAELFGVGVLPVSLHESPRLSC
jgi:SAM-dependent methyltransferase